MAHSQSHIQIDGYGYLHGQGYFSVPVLTPADLFFCLRLAVVPPDDDCHRAALFALGLCIRNNLDDSTRKREYGMDAQREKGFPLRFYASVLYANQQTFKDLQPAKGLLRTQLLLQL